MNVLKHVGTSHSYSCDSLAKGIWELCIARDIWLSVAHVPGKQNLAADFESQRSRMEAEWGLDIAALHNVLSGLIFQPDIDLIAPAFINYLFPKYVSYRPDPEAFVIDTFSLQWSKLDFYTFPPFSVSLFLFILSRILFPVIKILFCLYHWFVLQDFEISCDFVVT